MVGESLGCNHDPHPSYELYEGNIAETFQDDAYEGSASEITIFRNWLRGYCPDTDQNWKCVDIDRLGRNFQVVGNVLGTTGYTWTIDPGIQNNLGYGIHLIYRLGYPNMGNPGYNGNLVQASQGTYWADWNNGFPTTGPGGLQELDLDCKTTSHSPHPGTTTVLGNYDVQTGGIPTANPDGANQSLGSYTLPNSLFRSSKPTWFGSLTWPPFDPTNPPTMSSANSSLAVIPAGYRYVNGIDPPGSGTTQPPSNAVTTISTL
jgi:hypothetical protein